MRDRRGKPQGGDTRRRQRPLTGQLLCDGFLNEGQLALKGCWRPDLYDVASCNQFTCSDDRAVQVGKAFGHRIPGLRVLPLQQIPALDHSKRRRRVLKQFNQAHGLSVKQSKRYSQPVCHKTQHFFTFILGQNRCWIGAARPRPHRWYWQEVICFDAVNLWSLFGEMAPIPATKHFSSLRLGLAMGHRTIALLMRFVTQTGAGG
jgi:hypothetical protein